MPSINKIIKFLRDAASRHRCCPLHVFVSSTFVDLQAERLAVKEVLETCGCLPRLAENTTMIPGKPLIKQISHWLCDIDTLVLLVAERYGSRAPSERSWTEEEVRMVTAKPVRLLPYFVSHQLPPGIEFDKQKQEQLEAFKYYLQTLPNKRPVLAQYPQYAKGIPDLSIRVARDIGAIQSDIRLEKVVAAAKARIENDLREEMSKEAEERRDSYNDSFE